jgi:nitrate reductase gamma subunit
VTPSYVSADVLLFAALPYIALALFVAGTLERLVRHRESLTSRSSQFLENRVHFWAMVPFHYGILVVLAGHLLAFAVPAAVLGWNAAAIRLYVLEATGLAFALLASLGLGAAILRRAIVPTVRVTTTVVDWVVLAALLAQIVSGVAVAVVDSWGSSWFAAIASPYLWSILRFHPDVAAMAALPLAAKAHAVGAFVLIGVFPFTRLMHVITVPAAYLWRRPQLVRWHRRRSVALEKWS